MISLQKRPAAPTSGPTRKLHLNFSKTKMEKLFFFFHLERCLPEAWMRAESLVSIRMAEEAARRKIWAKKNLQLRDLISFWTMLWNHRENKQKQGPVTGPQLLPFITAVSYKALRKSSVLRSPWCSLTVCLLSLRHFQVDEPTAVQDHSKSSPGRLKLDFWAEFHLCFFNSALCLCLVHILLLPRISLRLLYIDDRRHTVFRACNWTPASLF